MRKRLQIFCLLLLPCLTLMGILGRGSPAALSTSSDAAIPASADNWGLSFPAEHETPIGNATADFLTQYDAWYVGDTSQKVIYLTFDCGYENGYTNKILDVLKEKQVTAAFFCTLPNIKAEPELIARMIKEGHIVGNHSVSHPSFAKISRTQMASEIENCDNYLREHFGYSAPYFRFPMGEYSECALELVGSLGFKCVFWSLAWNDWNTDSQKGSDTAFKTVTSRLHPGAVILLHSVSSDNAGALGDIIDYARKQGYVFKSLSDLK